MHREAVAVAELLGLKTAIPREAVATIGGYWQPHYSLPNPMMVEAVQMLARTEAILLDPVYTGKAMAGPIGLSRQGVFRREDHILFLHTGGAPSLSAYKEVLLAGL